MQALLDLESNEGPEPVTEREYLAQLYRMVKELRVAVVALNSLIEHQNERVRRLEDWQTRMVGALTVVSALAMLALGGVVLPLLLKLLAK